MSGGRCIPLVVTLDGDAALEGAAVLHHHPVDLQRALLGEHVHGHLSSALEARTNVHLAVKEVGGHWPLRDAHREEICFKTLLSPQKS